MAGHAHLCDGSDLHLRGRHLDGPRGPKINRVAESISTNSDAAGDFNWTATRPMRGRAYDETTHDIWVDANQDWTLRPTR